ncbi:hypothetical protein GS892_25035 [Rhodococcus hoagii]|nr:hypothetical protein [Prescottella equi]NKV08602.1 hypothetical protein [Prescottella equi]NKV09578.1 hypothetical protein [Prescottella equi]
MYFIRSNDDLVKIGHTTNIAKRKSAFSVGWGSILAIVPGTYEDEQNLHRRFAEHRARGAEWYHPASTIIDHINEIRQRLDISPIAAW